MLRKSLVLALIALLPALAPAPSAGAGEGITWCKDLTTGLAEAKETGRILMVCVNAKRVDDEARDEPAAKGLREVVYKDPRIVRRSRDFVCVFLTPRSRLVDYAELGNLGMHGTFISPQHIFISAEGDRFLFREEYWPYGKGEKAVTALLDMMKRAEREAEIPVAPSVPKPEVEDAPALGEERAAWIASMLELVNGTSEERDVALAALVRADGEGDCTGPLIELLEKSKRKVDLLRDLIRALGRDGLMAAAEPVSSFLTHKDPKIRANAAVSLEYIGNQEKKVVSALLKAAGKQKDPAIANHMCRALGRCGVKTSAARDLLLKKASGAKSEFASFGPIIGLAYFEGDEKAMRGVEKLLARVGLPGGGRGGGQNTVKRVLLSWTLAWIGDKKSAEFVRKKLLAELEGSTSRWAKGMRKFWDGVVECCDGQKGAMSGVEDGVRRTVGYASRWNRGEDDGKGLSLLDEARKDRDGDGFVPRGQGMLEAENRRDGAGNGRGGPGRRR
jgi:hypothetical protein